MKTWFLWPVGIFVVVHLTGTPDYLDLLHLIYVYFYLFLLLFLLMYDVVIYLLYRYQVERQKAIVINVPLPFALLCPFIFESNIFT